MLGEPTWKCIGSASSSSEGRGNRSGDGRGGEPAKGPSSPASTIRIFVLNCPLAPPRDGRGRTGWRQRRGRGRRGPGSSALSALADVRVRFVPGHRTIAHELRSA